MNKLFFVRYFIIVPILLLQACSSTNNKKITIRGKALDAKLGAVVVTNDSNIYYIDGMEYGWSKQEYGKSILVEGYLHEVDWGKPETSDSSAIIPIVAAQPFGIQQIIKEAKWKVDSLQVLN